MVRSHFGCSRSQRVHVHQITHTFSVFTDALLTAASTLAPASFALELCELPILNLLSGRWTTTEQRRSFGHSYTMTCAQAGSRTQELRRIFHRDRWLTHE